jgi:hypothetical protein
MTASARGWPTGHAEDMERSRPGQNTRMDTGDSEADRHARGDLAPRTCSAPIFPTPMAPPLSGPSEDHAEGEKPPLRPAGGLPAGVVAIPTTCPHCGAPLRCCARDGAGADGPPELRGSAPP